MSYRTYVNGVQIFGNNDSYDEWFEFLRKEGVKIGSDGEYDGYITDVDGALEVVCGIAFKECGGFEIGNPMDFSRTIDAFKIRETKGKTLVGFCEYIMDNAYVFLPVQFLKAISDEVEKKYMFEEERLIHVALKDGKKIHVRAG